MASSQATRLGYATSLYTLVSGIDRGLISKREGNFLHPLSLHAWRWGSAGTREGTEKRVALGQRPWTTEAERVTRSVVRSVGASLLLVRWDGHDEALTTA